MDGNNKDGVYMTKSMYPRSDWVHEVQRGDTTLEYQDWVDQRIESDLEEIEALNSSCD
jgi:hypothetical protein